MKPVLIFVFSFMMNSLTNAQSAQTFKADIDTATVNEIIQLEYFLASLLEKNNLDEYSGYLTDDYIRINQNGMLNKTQVLETMRTSPAKMFSMKPHDLSVRVYGNTAILNGMLDIETTNGEETVVKTSFFTKVFIKKDGKWYLASLHGNPLK